MPQPKLESVLLFGDAHVPYESAQAFDLMLKVGGWLKPHTLVSLGDLADFYSVSSHSKDPARIARLDNELGAVNSRLDELDTLGAKRKLFVAGNHCDRLTRYLQDKAPELYGIIDIPTLFRLKVRTWDYTPYKHDTRLGKLYITHDVGSAGRFSTYRALEKYTHSVVTGHAHRISYVVEGNAVGEYRLAAQFGWLGDANKVDYMTRVNVRINWALGFGVGVVNPKTGIAYLTPVPIIKSGRKLTCVCNGRYFEN